MVNNKYSMCIQLPPDAHSIAAFGQFLSFLLFFASNLQLTTEHFAV